MVDKNLFLYDFAVVAVMKNYAPYVKEWLNYHLLAGVDHFYIYDNESSDNLKEVLKPYVDVGTVTLYSGKTSQLEAYNNALQNKFACRYMAFIDVDEFIFPKAKPTLPETVDEILKTNSMAATLGVNSLIFGSNGQEKADYSRGVLDRFTARGKNVDNRIKTIANPRRVSFFPTANYGVYLDGNYSVNENGQIFFDAVDEGKTIDKIVINRYPIKSREEWVKLGRGNAENFPINAYNDEQEDGILKYRESRRNVPIVAKKIDYPKMLNALTKNLSPMIRENEPADFFKGKIENFLTCLNLSLYLKANYLEDATSLFEELSLNALHRAIFTNLTIPDVMLIIEEMPKILRLSYPVVGKILDFAIEIIPQVMQNLKSHSRYHQTLWHDFMDLDYKLDMLKSFKA